jgi:hypothetical protein
MCRSQPCRLTAPRRPLSHLFAAQTQIQITEYRCRCLACNRYPLECCASSNEHRKGKIVLPMNPAATNNTTFLGI